MVIQFWQKCILYVFDFECIGAIGVVLLTSCVNSSKHCTQTTTVLLYYIIIHIKRNRNQLSTINYNHWKYWLLNHLSDFIMTSWSPFINVIIPVFFAGIDPDWRCGIWVTSFNRFLICIYIFEADVTSRRSYISFRLYSCFEVCLGVFLLSWFNRLTGWFETVFWFVICCWVLF